MYNPLECSKKSGQKLQIDGQVILWFLIYMYRYISDSEGPSDMSGKKSLGPMLICILRGPKVR